MDSRYNLTCQLKRWPWIRRIATARELQPIRIWTTHWIAHEATGTSSTFNIDQVARFCYLFETQRDHPRRPFTILVLIPSAGPTGRYFNSPL